MKNLLSIMLLILTVPLSCNNISQGKKLLSTVNNPSFLVSNSTAYTHILKNAVIQQLAANGGGAAPADYQASLTTDTAQANYQSLVGFCATGSNTCSCEMAWTVPATAAGSVSYDRKKTLAIAVADVQSGQVKCTIPYSLWNEIATATVIKLNIVAATGNTSNLNCQSISYKKGTSVGANGDFLDDTLTPFRNIHRYSCFSKRQTAFQITNQYTGATPSSTPSGGGATNLFFASKFCSGVSNNGSCPTPRSGWSAQSYYRNFYIQSDQLGQINSTNGTYDCPKVLESINYSAGMTIPASDQGKYWPLDSTFALATTYSSDWNVGVRAATVISKVGDPNSDPETSQTACVNENTSQRMLEVGTITKCIGYAKKPNSDGTCGTIKDNNGRVRPMTRLRRYRVVYPPVFQPNGNVVETNPFGDEVYVADRLVVDATGVPNGSMIYGPKPCNFAWFDHEGVVDRTGTHDFKSDIMSPVGGNYATPAYVATSNYKYANPGSLYPYSVNPDGLVFPNFDVYGGVSNPSSYASCSAAMPVVDVIMGAPDSLRIVTSHRSRADEFQFGSRHVYLKEVHIQPIDAWSPKYVEDTSFQGCVPVSDPYVEPPLHFYKNDANKNANAMAWCTMAYPTQNPYWVELNQYRKTQGVGLANVVNYVVAGTALVTEYTSHQIGSGSTFLDAYNSCTGTTAAQICTMTGGSGLCSAYLAKPATTCDRTVMYDPNQAFRTFPLQAKDADIDTMLQNDMNLDKNYSCQFSVNATKSKVRSKAPSSGCCGVVNGTAILNNIINSAVAGSSGHLEPFQSAASPTTRFCGNPVE